MRQGYPSGQASVLQLIGADVQHVYRAPFPPCLLRLSQNEILDCPGITDMGEQKLGMRGVSRVACHRPQSEYSLQKACRMLYILHLVHITVVFYLS